MKTALFFLLTMGIFLLPGRVSGDVWTLWYERPADVWHEALPVGNGHLGAMVHGGLERDLLQLNDDTVWSGDRSRVYDRVGAHEHFPEIRRLLFAGNYREAENLVNRHILGERPLGAYQPLGDLVLDFPSLGTVSEYRRELDLDTAVARTTFREGDTVFTREVFTSAPANVLVVRLTSSEPGRITVQAGLTREEGASTESVGRAALVMRGQADKDKPTAGVRFIARLEAIAEGGRMRNADGVLSVEEADAVTFLVASETDFRHPSDDREDTVAKRLARAAEHTYDSLHADHVADHQQYFRRVAIDLGETESSALPTDERIKRARDGEVDPALSALHFQYGRYLLIASSRPGSMAANLQGLWNHLLNPPWFSGYHIDVNVQMNYWPAETANLSEMHQPKFDLIDHLREPGRRTARDVYGARGMVVSHRTNLGFFTSPVQGLTIWPTGAGWLSQHLWEHYRFTLDREFLAERAFPVMRDVAEFYLDWLVEHPETGLLVSGPSFSPEHGFLLPDGTWASLSMGPAMDQQIIAEVFDYVLQAVEILEIDDTFVQEVRAKRARLASGENIGSDGRLMEWAKEYEDRDPGHRHVSHLYAVYPGWTITPRTTPERAEAAAKSLAHRISSGGTGDRVNLSDSSNTGWSLAWNTGLWARLGEARLAHEAATALLERATFPNLMTLHPSPNSPGVFQIDANLGVTAGMAEMLLQSHAGEIELLPALPAGWPSGQVRGLRARGAFTVDIEWDEGTLVRAAIQSDMGGPAVVRFGDKVSRFEASRGETIILDKELIKIK